MVNRQRVATKGFAFVIADQNGKPSTGDRRLIRSHVMRGKNTRTWRSGAGARARARATPDQTRSSSESVEMIPRPKPGYAVAPTSPSDEADEADEADEEFLVTVLRTPNDMYMFRFADEIDSSSRAMLFDYYSVIRDAMYPVEWCVRFDTSKTPWFYWLLSDEAFLHSVLFIVSMVHDAVSGQRLSSKTRKHVGKTLENLNRSLADPRMATADSTVATIVSMCMAAEVFGDHESAGAHVSGLRQIVKMRGGVESFKHNLQLYVKICRVDIGWCLVRGGAPLYYRETLTWDRAFASILGSSPGGFKPQRGPCSVSGLLDSIDLRLSNVYQDLRDFSRLANFLFRRKKLDPDDFQQLMTSMQYRLLYLESEMDDVVGESFRLGMLGVVASFFLNAVGCRLRFAYTSQRLRETLRNVDPSEYSSPTTRLVLAWTLVAGAMAVFDVREDVWLLPKLAALRDALGDTWPDANGRLQKVLWIRSIHDSMGVKVYERLVLHVAQIPSPRTSEGGGGLPLGMRT